MSTIYLDRNNSITRRLQVDGATVAAGTLTRAIFLMHGAAKDGGDIKFDTSTDTDISLTENATTVVIKGGLRDIKPGRYHCLLTCFDSASPEGLAWDQISVTVREWPTA